MGCETVERAQPAADGSDLRLPGAGDSADERFAVRAAAAARQPLRRGRVVLAVTSTRVARLRATGTVRVGGRRLRLRAADGPREGRGRRDRAAAAAARRRAAGPSGGRPHHGDRPGGARGPRAVGGGAGGARPMSPRVLMGLMFFPRGGSAHVARNLATALPAAGWEASIVSGSLAIPGRPGDARAFYRDLDVHPVDFTAALDAPDPLLADPPFHPSFEERVGAPDRIFASLDDATAEHLVAVWARELERAGAAEADVLHLHHLTPLNEAAARVAPDVPVVGHLHGTELLMLEAIEANPERWAHGAAWTERMRRWAERAERLIVLSKSQDARAERLLGVPHRAVRRGQQRLRPAALPAARGRPRRPLGAVRPGAGRLRRPRAPLRGALHRGQARPAADRGLRGRARALRRARAARARRRLPGRVRGRASRRGDRAHGRAGRPSRRLARARRAAELHQRRRCHRSGLGGRAVRPGAGRGHGLRAAGHRGEFPRPGGDRGRGGDGLARRAG